MRIEQNQVRVVSEELDKIYTFDQNGRCNVTLRDGQKWIGGGDSELALWGIFLDVIGGYDIDDQSLENYTAMHPKLGQSVTTYLYEKRLAQCSSLTS